MTVLVGQWRVLVLFALFVFSPVGHVKATSNPLAVRSLLLDGTRAGDRIVAVGERGNILLSDNSGLSWAQAQVPTNATLTAVTFIDARQGWAVGHDAVILHTTDGGNSWVEQHAAPEWEAPLLDIYFTDERAGFAVGAYSLFLETVDGGASWIRRSLTDDDIHLNAIVALSPERMLITGEAGRILVSSDQFRTATGLELPSVGSLFGGLAISVDELLVFGLRGRVYRSADGGQSWMRVPTNIAAALMGGTVSAEGRIILVGAGGTILISGDLGNSFVSPFQIDRSALAAVVEAPDGALVLLGEQGARRIEPAGATAALRQH